MKGVFYPVRKVALLLVLLLPTFAATYATNLSEPICTTVEGSGKKYEICLTDVTYDYNAGTSTWTYTARTIFGNAISHFVFGFPCGTAASDYTATTGCGSVAYGNDPTTGVDGIKFDCLADSGGLTVSFTLNGIYSIGLIDYAIKTGGSGQRVFVFDGFGPSCSSVPSMPTGSPCANAVTYLSNYGLITIEDLNTNSDVHYNVFVGGDLISYPGGGDYLGPDGIFSTPTERSLEVAGEVKSGANIKYSAAFAPPSTNTITKINSSQYQVNGYTFNLNTSGAELVYDITLADRAAQIKSDLEAASAQLANAAANNAATGNLTFNVNTKDANGIAVFHIDASDIASNANVQLNNYINASTIVINVSGTNVNWTSGVNVNIAQSNWSKIVWNFPEATSIAVNSLKGIVLAPYAAFTSNSANEGSVAVKTYNGNGEIHRPYFSGDFSSVCSTTPPATRQIGIRVLLQGGLVLPGCFPPEINIMRAILQEKGVLPITNPYGLPQTYADINNPGGAAGEITDWIHIELRDGNNPSIVLDEQAGLLQPDGDVVNSNGEPLVFSSTSNPVYLVVKHRNHISISSPLVSLNDGDTYDFTTGLDKAYGNSTLPMAKVSDEYAMWAGDANGDDKVYNNANPSDAEAVRSRVLNDPGNTGFFGSGPVSNYIGIDPVYETFDINLDGKVYDNADPSDASLVESIILKHPSNTGVFGSGPVSNFQGIYAQLPYSGATASNLVDDTYSGSSAFKHSIENNSIAPAKGQVAGIMSIYPNPNAIAQATLALPAVSEASEAFITITNLNGQVLQSQQVDLVKGFNQILIETGDLLPGMYLIQIKGTREIYAPIKLMRVDR